jgi:hypothetical protein
MIWSHRRSGHHWGYICQELWRNDTNFGNAKLKKDLRVDFATFDMLCNEVRGDLQGQDTVMRKCITVEQKIALTLDILANAKTFYQAGKNVGVSESAARKWFYESLEALKDN